MGGAYLVGETIKLSVGATGTGALAYQWRKDGVVIGKTAATAALYSFLCASDSDSGVYDCVVTNAGGSVITAGVRVLGTVPSVFSSVTGTYSGLVKASASQPSPGGTVSGLSTEGQFVAAVLKTGAFSGKLTIDGLVLSVDGIFDSTGTARFKPALGTVLSILRPGKSALELTVNLDLATSKLTGTVTQRLRSAVAAVSTLEADRAYYNGTTLVVPDEYLSVNGNTKGDGVYTVVFGVPTGDAHGILGNDCPQGEGVATAKVSKGGIVSFAGTLADGTTFTAATALSKENRGGLFVPLYKGGGFVSGWVLLDSTDLDSDFSASQMLWSRPYLDVQHYAYGWPEGITLDMAGAKYAVVAGQSAVSGVLETTSNLVGNLTLNLGWGSQSGAGDVSKTVNLSSSDVVNKVLTPDTSFTLSVARASGQWKGSFTHTDGTMPAFEGVIYQKGQLAGGHGYFLSATPAAKNGKGQGGLAKLVAFQERGPSPFGQFLVSGSFSESYTETLKTVVLPDGGGTMYENVPSGTTTFTVVGTLTQGGFSAVDMATSVSVTVGGYTHSGSLEEATTLSLSGRRAVYNLLQPDPTDINGERQISVGTVTYVWTPNSVSVSGALKLAAGNIATQGASSTAGAVTSEVDVMLSFGGFDGTRQGHVSGTATSTRRVVGSGEMAEEYFLASASLRGSTDYTKPACAIGAPANAARILQSTEGIVTLSGTASDDTQLGEVSVRVNGGEWTNAELAFAQVGKDENNEPLLSINKGSWSTALTLVAGTNVIEVKATDGDGNESPIAKRSLQYVVSGSLQVTVDGQGGVSAGFGGTTSREVGVSYTVTATPKPGFVFGGWSVEGPELSSIGVTEADLGRPAFKFTFVEGVSLTGISLTPKFVANPFATAAGSYTGLVKASRLLPGADGTDSNVSTEGILSATVEKTGVFSGKLTIDGFVLSVAGEFDSTGVARFGANRVTGLVVPRAGKSALVVALSLDLSASTDGGGKLKGTVTQYTRSEITAVSDVNADRAFYNGTTLVVPDEFLTVSGATRGDGVFTAFWTPQAQQASGLASSAYPQGKGFATLKVSKAGIVSLAGILSDGTSVSASAPLSKAKTWPLFVQLYNKLGSGFIRGEVTLDATATESDMSSSEMLWVRSYMDAQHYPYGWEDGLKLDFRAAKYAVSSAQSVLSGLGAADADGNAKLTLSGVSSGTQEKALNLSVADAVSRVTVSDMGYAMAVARGTGLLSGSFTHSTGGKTPFFGVIYQKGTQAGGYGFFLTPVPAVKDYTGESGELSLLVR